MNNKLHHQHLIDAVEHNHTGKECHNPDCKALKKAGDQLINAAATFTDTSPRPGFQEALLLRLKEERHATIQEPMTHRIVQRIKDRFSIKAVLSTAGAVFLVLLVAGILTFFPKFSSGPNGEIPVVQAGADFVSVSLPVRIEFPYPQATVDDIRNYVSITPTPPTNTLSYIFDGQYLTVHHEKNLRYNTEYTITIVPGVHLGEGNTLTEEVSVTFVTRPRTGQQAKGGARTLYLNSYNMFTGYTVNAYDEIHEIPINNEDDGATYRFTVFESSPTEFLQVYTQSKKNYTSGMWSSSSTPFVPKNSVIIDEQTNKAPAGYFTYSPQLPTVGVYAIRVTKSLPSPEEQSISTKKRGGEKETTLYFFLVNTKLAMLNERLGHDLPTWVVDQKTAAGVEKATITMYGRDGKTLVEEVTDKLGQLDTTILQTTEQKPDYVAATYEDDFVFSTLDIGWFNSFYSGDWTNQILPYQAVIYTDRPVYKPGDTVSFKTIIRNKKENGAYNEAPKNVHVVARELTYGQAPPVVYEKDLTTTAYGTAADSFQLTSELKTGTYELVITENGSAVESTQFSVEFYQKPDAELLVLPEKEVVVKGDTLNIVLNARYFFGEPVKQKSGIVRVLGGWYGDNITSVPFTLDTNGSASIQITINDNVPTWYEGGTPLTLEAAFTDESGKEIIGRKIITIYTSAVTVVPKEQQALWGLRTDEEQRLVFISKSNLTEEVLSGIDATVSIHETYSYANGYSDQTLFSTTTTSNVLGEIELSHTFTAGGSYRIHIQYQDERGNSTASDFYTWVKPNGKSVGGETIYDPRIHFSPNKETYRVGETATIDVFLPRSEGQLLWSVNTEVFANMKVEQITNNRYEIKLPITDEVASGFYLSAFLFNDDSFVEGNQYVAVEGKRLTVDISSNTTKHKPGDKVTLAIKTIDSNGKPIRSEASVSLVDKAIFSVKSEQSTDIYDAFYTKPDEWLKTRTSIEPIVISPAEGGGCFLPGTMILMADGRRLPIEQIQPGDKILTREAPFSNRLTSDTVVRTFKHTVQEYLLINNSLRVTPVHRIFISGRWQQVGEARVGDWFIDAFGQNIPITSIQIIHEPVDVYNFETSLYHTYIADGIYVHNDKGGDGDIRSNFVDTAYWNAHVETNEKGEGEITITLPDNLTTWVAAAKAVSKNTDLGQGTTEIISHKDIIVRPFVPQFVRTDDTISIPVAVHNNTDQNMPLRLLASVTGGTITNESIKSVTLKPNSVTTVMWPITVANSKKLTLTVKAETTKKDIADGVELEIPVYPKYGMTKTVFTGEETTNFTFTLPPNNNPLHTTAVLTLSPSLLGALPDIMDKLTGYPYGCVEQTMTKQLPNILTARYRNLLGLQLTTEKEKQLAAGFDRLANFQHGDGGFGWWENDDTNIWMTGYVLEGLWQAKQAGLLKGKEAMFDALLTHTKEIVGTLNSQEQIYLAYVLSHIEPKSVRQILEAHARKVHVGTNYDAQSLGYIALGLYHAGNTTEARQMLGTIRAAQVDNHWVIEENSDYHGALKDSYSATGVNLLALLTIDGNPTDTKPIIAWLMANRGGYEGLWGSTRQSAQILLALITYVEISQELEAVPEYTIKLNDQIISSKPFTDVNKPVEVVLPVKDLSGSISITVEQTGTGTVYSTAILTTHHQKTTTNQSAPFTIQRDYLTPKGEKKTNFLPGDLVLVRLTTKTSEPLNYVMIEDYLPAGLEAINPNLETTTQGNKQHGYGGWYYDAFDMRDHRVNLFEQRLWQAGVYTFEYMARVSYTGTFSAPGPRIELMYEPEKQASGGDETVVAK